MNICLRSALVANMLTVTLLSITAGQGRVGAVQGGGRRSVSPTAASECSPGGPSLKALGQSLSVKYSDPSDFARALDRAVGIDTKFADAHRETTVFSDNGLSIALEMPYQGYRFGMLEALRKRDPVDAVSVPTFGAIVVSPSTIDAPDIVKLVLE